MRQRLWFRMVLLVVGGMSLVAILSGGISFGGLLNIRDHTIEEVSRILKEQSIQTESEQTRWYANETQRSIARIEQLTTDLATATGGLPDGKGTALSDFHTTRAGIRFSHSNTTMVVPPDTNSSHLTSDISTSVGLNSMLPVVGLTVPAVHRVVYIGTSGLVRTYPLLDVSEIEADWDPHALAAYIFHAQTSLSQGAADMGRWNTITSFDGTRQVLARTSMVWRKGQFHGIIIVEANIEELLSYLPQFGDKVGAWVQDDQGRLIEGTPMGQRVHQLFTAIHGPPRSSSRTATNWYDVEVGSTSYVLIYQPIERTPWTLFISMPLDRFTSSAHTLAPQINQRSNRVIGIILAGTLLLILLSGMVAYFVVQRQLGGPIDSLVQATDAVAGGDLHPIEVEREDELGQLTRSFNAMTKALAISQTENEQHANHLLRAVTELERSLEKQKNLWNTLQEVSSPIIPVLEGTLVMPLVGNLNKARVERSAWIVLTRIEQEHTRLLLLDVTGVASVDEASAQELMRMAQAVKLLGCRVMLVGISSQLAETLVGIGAEIRGIQTATTLQAAMERLMNRSLRQHIHPGTTTKPPHQR